MIFIVFHRLTLELTVSFCILEGNESLVTFLEAKSTAVQYVYISGFLNSSTVPQMDCWKGVCVQWSKP